MFAEFLLQVQGIIECKCKLACQQALKQSNTALFVHRGPTKMTTTTTTTMARHEGWRAQEWHAKQGEFSPGSWEIVLLLERQRQRHRKRKWWELVWNMQRKWVRGACLAAACVPCISRLGKTAPDLVCCTSLPLVDHKYIIWLCGQNKRFIRIYLSISEWETKSLCVCVYKRSIKASHPQKPNIQTLLSLSNYTLSQSHMSISLISYK